MKQNQINFKMKLKYVVSFLIISAILLLATGCTKDVNFKELKVSAGDNVSVSDYCLLVFDNASLGKIEHNIIEAGWNKTGIIDLRVATITYCDGIPKYEVKQSGETIILKASYPPDYFENINSCYEAKCSYIRLYDVEEKEYNVRLEYDEDTITIPLTVDQTLQ